MVRLSQVKKQKLIYLHVCPTFIPNICRQAFRGHWFLVRDIWFRRWGDGGIVIQNISEGLTRHGGDTGMYTEVLLCPIPIKLKPGCSKGVNYLKVRTPRAILTFVAACLRKRIFSLPENGGRRLNVFHLHHALRKTSMERQARQFTMPVSAEPPRNPTSFILVPVKFRPWEGARQTCSSLSRGYMLEQHQNQQAQWHTQQWPEH